jgi:uncharacterized metal-binding protein
MSSPAASCAECPFRSEDRLCRVEGGSHPDDCPTLTQQPALEEALREYDTAATRGFALQASIQEAEGYTGRGTPDVMPAKPRLVEIAEFARRMGYGHLGLVFCGGLTREAAVVGRYYREQGFRLTSVICKVGRVPKERIGVRDDQKIAIGRHESMCNPITQATIMNHAGTDLNIVLGLCVGHDSLVFRHSKAPCTVLAAKDRVLGHNPLAAVYTMQGYYRHLTRKA